MEEISGWIGALGAAVGVVIFAAAEIARRILKAAPKNNPTANQLRKDIETLKLDVEMLTLEKEAAMGRIRKLERNGERNGKNGK